MMGNRVGWWILSVIGGMVVSSCAPLTPPAGRELAREAGPTVDSLAEETERFEAWKPRKPIVPPRVAMLAGLLPIRALGVDTFRSNFPQYDGRGVVIAILDNGLDPGVPGLMYTSTDSVKILDVRDFSGEGRIPLDPLETINGDTVVVAGRVLSGFRSISRVTRPPYFAGVFRERALGVSDAADVNGNGRTSDEFPVIVTRHRGEWIVVSDTDNDRSFNGEAFVRDYAVAREVFSFLGAHDAAGPGPTTIAVNFGRDGSTPVLDFVYDNSGHGTHVAGIAAGHDMFGVEGFDGIAPGAQLLGLKIADNSRGGISVGGSVVNAMEYAAAFAREHDLSLIINMSHGIGNEDEGEALIDSIIDEFTIRHPRILFVVSAGNEGPGISSVGFPGSAQHAMSVCALYPGIFAHSQRSGAQRTLGQVAPWSARGGEIAKPDLCAPGKAYSTVPLWHSGKEVLEGTSQAAPQIAGAAALLQSAVRNRNEAVRGVDIARALKNTAIRPPGVTALDVGAGVPNITAALNWLLAGHQAGVYSVEAVNEGTETHRGSAAFRRSGFRSSADTVQRFVVTSVGGQPAARLLLEPDVEWIQAPAVVEPQGGPVSIELTYDQSQLQEPGIYVGTVLARSATDTSAGALFELRNTVVVPHGLSPRGYKHELGQGEVHRHFFEVPQGAGGLEVTVGLTDPSHRATLYLFEPDGRPFRGQSETKVGGFATSTASIFAAGDELVPGVYEAVVIAPPSEEVSFQFEVAVPDVVVESVIDGPVASVRNLSRSRVRAIVSAELLGAASSLTVAGVGSIPSTIRIVPPSWADRMLLSVSIPKSTWHQITGFGVTVFDTAGVRVSDGPLNYSGAHQIVDLVSPEHLAGLDLELMPAFAHSDLRPNWFAELEVVFLLPDAVGLKSPDGSERIGVLIDPIAARNVQFVLTPDLFGTRPGLLPLVEVRAQLPFGPPALRRAVAGSGDRER